MKLQTSPLIHASVHQAKSPNRSLKWGASIAAALMFAVASVYAQQLQPRGEVKGDAWVHTQESLAATAQQSDVCLPPAATGEAMFCGNLKFMRIMQSKMPKNLPQVDSKPKRSNC